MALPDAFYDSVAALIETEQFSVALNTVESQIAEWPLDARLLNLAGVCHYGMDRKLHAAQCWQQAIIHSPDDAQLHSNLGLAFRDLGQLVSAEAVLLKALEIDPECVNALNNLGMVLLDLERAEEAERVIRRAVLRDPQSSQAHRNLGLIFEALRRLPEAEQVFRQTLASHPEQTALYGDLARVLRGQGRYADAEESFRQAAAARPDSIEARSNLGTFLRELGRLHEAEALHRQTLANHPDAGHAWNDLGIVVHDLGDLQAAIAHFERAVAQSPHDARVRLNLAYALLAAGRYSEAWPQFEQASATGVTESPKRAPGIDWLSSATWDENACLGKQSLLVLHEEGLGDALQFCRYLPLMLARFRRVGYVCPKPLRRLFAQSLCERWPDIVLLDALPADSSMWDYQTRLLSLPMLSRTCLDTVPAPLPYLFALAEQARPWHEKLAALGDDGLPRIGVVWAGGNTHSVPDAQRSIAPETFATRLLDWPGAHWISLQKTDTAAKQLLPAHRANLVDWMEDVRDFADTAALISGLDLVISVDTSVAHLAAAMGKPVWVLNRYAGCWRWLRNRDDSPWYPGLRLFTQKQRGNWEEVLKRCRHELEMREMAD
ncbi:tetratricopeptide repeat protein [Paraburkholderia sp. Ac-20340]|uniref:tetratricopeptide repeat-containing glycosyltransferase family protein n=1 Tax=Paraburkholderia sp. Ac-20340 TaxID=2703888 RepID=UPI0019802D22|nr:tetratricopeptide repeat-containing glycosyltransferase family protein [Paraburkholderia sp. Ac-20340]MBN3856254.1 tetratricopeptide repeat protein [Paraburkholderia sp. Ac-20340]